MFSFSMQKSYVKDDQAQPERGVETEDEYHIHD